LNRGRTAPILCAHFVGTNYAKLLISAADHWRSSCDGNPHAKPPAVPSLAVFPVLLAQFVILLLAALALWQWQGVVAGYSGLCGGLIALLPNVYFAHRAFRFSGARAAKPSSGRFMPARQAN
jgi:hypothetical protein